jgi:hypothetical protein
VRWWLVGLGLAACARAAAPVTPPLVVHASPPPLCPEVEVAAAGDDAAQIRDTWLRVRRALRRDDGCGLVAMIDADSLRVVEVMRQWALRMPRAELALQPAGTLFTVIDLRRRFGARLRDLTATELFADGAAPSFVRFDVLDVDLAGLAIEDDVAHASLERDGRPVDGGQYRFVREGGRWKLSLESVLRVVDTSTRRFRAEAATRVERMAPLWDPVGD